jgi:flagellum-specific peptidoglycan hydrolase FlgJ
MSKEVIAFIIKHSKDVIKSVNGKKIFPSIKMAQMIIESSGRDENGKFGIGKGLAVRKANNYFGIKADKRWKGRKIALSTPKDGKPVSLFRVYTSPLDSLLDHTQFLLKNSRYSTNHVFEAKTPQGQAEALQRAGYSESPTYSRALIALVKAYKLTDLDKPKENHPERYMLIAGGVLMIIGIMCFQDEIKNKYKQLLKK